MKLFRLAFVAGAAIAAGCDVNSGGTPTVNAASAYVRYVNAVNDVNTLDLRFVDAVEGSPNFTNIQFRQFTPFQAVTAGSRLVRVFVEPAPYFAVATPARQQLIAQTLVAEATFNFTAGVYYTIFHTGQSGLVFSNPDVASGGTGNVPNGAVTVGGTTLNLRVESFPTVTNPPAAAVFIRSVNLGQSAPATSALGNQDIFVARETDAVLTSVASPNGALWSAVPPYPAAGSVTPYVILAPRPAGVAAAAPAAQGSTYRWSTQAPAAPGVPIAQQQSYVIGLAGNTTANGTAGAQVAGSIMTAVIYPRSVLGSAAPQSPASGAVPTFLAPSVFVMVDRNPPRTAP